MAELELVGIHADGEHIVLVDEEGQRHRLPIDDALRAAVRRDRPQLEQIRAEGLRPREIQALVRAGASAEDIAADTGVPVEQIRRYEGPALAEREHVAQRARALTLGREPGSPTLGDLVVDRLAARGVETIEWDARRRGAEPWEVLARFVAGDRAREATWQVDLAARSAVAIDDESRWLSETDLGSGTPRRHLSAVRGARLYDVETDADVAPALAAVDAVIRDTRPRDLRSVDADEHVERNVDAADADDSGEHDSDDAPDTEALLDELSAARGVRQRLEIDDDALAAQVLADDAAAEDDEPEPRKPTVLTPAPHTPALWDEPAAEEEEESEPPPQEHTDTDDEPDATTPDGAHPAASRPDEATDATVIKQRPTRRSQKNRRTSVPSWDEIVFGARSDQ
ncbi:septation protein SepH [Pseudactinotalea sp.]|uniref:septation protein SepH n=1 Tax=Pseudactinotalea sp. TaxID=1926260 RepID=UPI003B3AF782